MTDVLSLEPVDYIASWKDERRLQAVVELTRLIEQADNPADAAAQCVEALEDMGWAQDD